jgi:hypothetical protein
MSQMRQMAKMLRWGDVHDESMSFTYSIGGANYSAARGTSAIHLDDRTEVVDREFADNFEDTGRFSDEPDERSYEGYTGNAGPTLDLVYRHTLLVCWPRSKHILMMLDLGPTAALAHVQTVVSHAEENTTSHVAQQKARDLVAILLKRTLAEKSNASSSASASRSPYSPYQYYPYQSRASPYLSQNMIVQLLNAARFFSQAKLCRLIRCIELAHLADNSFLSAFKKAVDFHGGIANEAVKLATVKHVTAKVKAASSIEKVAFALQTSHTMKHSWPELSQLVENMVWTKLGSMRYNKGEKYKVSGKQLMQLTELLIKHQSSEPGGDGPGAIATAATATEAAATTAPTTKSIANNVLQLVRRVIISQDAIQAIKFARLLARSEWCQHALDEEKDRIVLPLARAALVRNIPNRGGYPSYGYSYGGSDRSWNVNQILFNLLTVSFKFQHAKLQQDVVNVCGLLREHITKNRLILSAFQRADASRYRSHPIVKQLVTVFANYLLTQSKKTEPTWAMPHVSCSNRIIETFCHDANRNVLRFRVGEFRSIVQARKAAAALQRTLRIPGIKAGEATGSGRTACCVLRKVRSTGSRLTQAARTKADELQKLKQTWSNVAL